MASSQKSAEYCAQLVREIEELHATIDRRNKEIAESIRVRTPALWSILIEGEGADLIRFTLPSLLDTPAPAAA